MSYYTGQGDYYSGKGDPGLFGFLGKAVGTLARVGASAVPGPVGIAARGITSKLPSFGRTTPVQATMPRVTPPRITRAFTSSAPAPVTVNPVTGQVQRKRKRMNVANPKALRRAIRREQGFVKLARRALKGTSYSVVSKSSRRPAPRISVRETGPGSVTVR